MRMHSQENPPQPIVSDRIHPLNQFNSIRTRRSSSSTQPSIQLNPLTHMKPWIILFLAGVCEVVWTLGLKFSNGLTKPAAAAITIAFMALSMYLLAVATRSISIGVTYPIWVSIGVVGAFLGGAALFGDRVTIVQAAFCLMIVIGIVGLKLTSKG